MMLSDCKAVTVVVAAELPDILPERKPLKGVIGFIRKHPAMAIGLFILALMLFIALAAPILWTVDPTALATSRTAVFTFSRRQSARESFPPEA